MFSLQMSLRTLLYMLMTSTMVNITIQINLLPDNDLTGIVFEPLNEIHAHSTTEYILYKIDTSELKFSRESISDLEKKCGKDNLRLFHYKLTLADLEQYWKINSRTKIPTKMFSEIKINSISKLLNETDNLFNINCTQLEVVADEIKIINNQLNKLSELDWNTIQQLIPIDYIKTDIEYQLAKYNDSLITPLISNAIFTTDWQFLNKKYHFIKDIIYFEFSLPLYNKKTKTIFNIHPKPLIWENEIYLYNTENKYALLDTKNKTFYNENSFMSNCIKFLNNYYCTRTSNEISRCDTYYFNPNTGKFHSECFTKLKQDNMITQIGKKLYFTTIYNMDITINQFGLEYSITITEPSKIMDKINYNIRTNFFNFSPKNESTYEIFSSHSSDNAIYYKLNLKSKLIQLFILSTIQLLLLVTILKGINYLCSQTNKKQKTDTLNTLV